MLAGGKIYLKMKEVGEALDILFQRFGHPLISEAEEIPVIESCGRITSDPVFAKISSPPFYSAAMDGIAADAEHTYGATERNPKRLKLESEAVWINTGQPMPAGKNSVIMAEKLNQADENNVEITSSVFPWQHVRKVGENFVATELLFPRNHKIQPFDLGTLLEGGNLTVNVRERPKVVLIPTGSELVGLNDLGKPLMLESGKVIESNSYFLSALIRECGAEPIKKGIVEDRPEKIIAALLDSIKQGADLVLIIAGSSAGKKDYTSLAIEKTGKILVHGVTMMPGKPTIIGDVKKKPVFGVPGYSVSAYISFMELIRPFLYRLQGSRAPSRPSLKVAASRDIPSKLGLDEFIRVNIGKVGDKTVAVPLPRGAGSINTLSRAQGIIRIPSLSEGMSRDEETDAELLVENSELENTLVIIGSHDITLDILSDEIKSKADFVRIASGNVGSLGGLMALRNGTAHAAGSHLLDTRTGEYNLYYIRKYLKGFPVHVFNLVKREQGLIIQKGNPKAVKGIQDLEKGDICFVNRQTGSGTRVLLDYKLDEAGIDPASIKGYENEEYTHMNVAAAVLSGQADTGLGIMAAARALGLDFIPVASEQYDLIVPSSFLNNANIKLLIETAASREYRERVSKLGGYDPGNSGNLWKIL